MIEQPRNIRSVLDTFAQQGSPRIVTQVNDYDVRVARVSRNYSNEKTKPA